MPIVLGVNLNAAPTAALAAYVVTTFEVPGSSSTDIWDINDAGQFVGTAFTDRQFGYLYAQGSLLRLDGPAGAEYVSALGISESTAVVGSFGDSTRPRQVINYVWDPANNTQVPELITVSTQRGFVWQSGVYSPVDVPFAGAVGTTLRTISPDGRYVSGTYELESGSQLNGFVLDRSAGTFTALTWDAGFGIAQGINGAGQMVGDMRIRSEAVRSRPGVGCPFDVQLRRREPPGATRHQRRRADRRLDEKCCVGFDERGVGWLCFGLPDHYRPRRDTHLGRRQQQPGPGCRLLD